MIITQPAAGRCHLKVMQITEKIRSWLPLVSTANSPLILRVQDFIFKVLVQLCNSMSLPIALMHLTISALIFTASLLIFFIVELLQTQFLNTFENLGLSSFPLLLTLLCTATKS